MWGSLNLGVYFWAGPALHASVTTGSQLVRGQGKVEEEELQPSARTTGWKGTPAWRGRWEKQWHRAHKLIHTYWYLAGRRGVDVHQHLLVLPSQGEEKREIIPTKVKTPTSKSPRPSSNSTTANSSQTMSLSTIPITPVIFCWDLTLLHHWVFLSCDFFLILAITKFMFAYCREKAWSSFYLATEMNHQPLLVPKYHYSEHHKKP